MNAMQLQKEIVELAKKAGQELDKVDIGITLTVAMNSAQRDDLEAMMDFLTQQKKMKPSELLFNVLHDLYGLKAVYQGLPAGDCFCPRSHGYAARLSKAV